MRTGSETITRQRDTVAAPPRSRKRKRRWLRRIGVAVLVLMLPLAAARPFLPWAVRWYVNRTLDRSQIYEGRIGKVELHLYRGAYSIYDVRLMKVSGDVPVPLYSARRVEFTVQWKALLHHKLVGQVVMEQPELNFVDAPDPAESQTGAGGPWLQIIRDLFPFKINGAVVHNGSVHFRSFQTKRPVDVYLSRLEATVDDLTNIGDDIAPLITTVHAKALAMDQATFELEMRLDPFSYRPTFHVATRLLGLDVTKLNDLARAYGAFDFERGWFDLVVEVDAKEGFMNGYVKPLFRSLKVFSLIADVARDNPLEYFWKALVGGVTYALRNQPREQLATVIPFTADLNTTRPDVLATIGNLLRNAFIRAYLPRLQPGLTQDQFLQFEAPEISDAAYTGG
jgi:hypothetical protein